MIENKDKEKILRYAREKYISEGFYKSSMDTLASELQISKKTIYKYFPSKDKLVEEVAYHLMNEVNQKIETIILKESNAAEKTLELIHFFSSVILKFSEKWLSDIKIHAPEIWIKIDEFRTKRMLSVLGKVITQGQEEDIFKKYPVQIVVNIFIASIRSIINPDFLLTGRYSYQEALALTFEMLFDGILTPTGKKYFNKNLIETLK